MSAPIAVTSTCTPKEIEALKDVELSIHPEDCFSTAVGPPAKKTLARWHVTTPEEVSFFYFRSLFLRREDEREGFRVLMTTLRLSCFGLAGGTDDELAGVDSLS